MKFEIGIPTLNRVDLLIPSLLMYNKQFTSKILVVDNGNQNIHIPNIEVINTEKLSVGASWNVLCRKIFVASDYALILNDDIYLGNNQQQIEKLIDKKKNFYRATIDWCAFLISKKTWKEVGEFDECFYPAYYEDNSYEYRMKLKGIVPIKTPELNPFIYRSSQTMEKEPQILEAAKRNKEKYIKMWGGEPTREKFTKPAAIC